MGRGEAGPADARPTVSVVIPVRDAPERIRACLEALDRQSYPRDRLQVIVVDNGSTDHTREVVREFPVLLVVEDSATSPYVARNAGIEVAAGEVVAFTDASCVPDPGWVEEGVKALLDMGADLVGGHVQFTFSPSPSAGEYADALLNVDVAASIHDHRACMTGNLLVRREVIEAIGPFDAGVRSGGDMRWTRRATDAGFRLVFASSARVEYPARPLVPLLAKQYRVGRGVPGVWSEFGMNTGDKVTAAIGSVLPPHPGRLALRARARLPVEARRMRTRLWFAVWGCKLARSAGIAAGLLRPGG